MVTGPAPAGEQQYHHGGGGGDVGGYEIHQVCCGKNRTCASNLDFFRIPVC